MKLDVSELGHLLSILHRINPIKETNKQTNKKLDTSFISGMFLQTLSALISMIRYYMGWMAMNTKVYNTNFIIIAITFTIVFMDFMVLILYSVPPPPICLHYQRL